MNVAEIKYCDIANGVGVRTSVFVSGCRHRCVGCFNEEAWSFEAGRAFSREVEDEVLASLEPGYVVGLTVLGGEPLEPENSAALAPFLERVRAERPEKSIWLYTGFTWEDVMDGPSRAHTADAARVTAALDVLVDGPFVLAERDISLRFRGSRNQRIIDVSASLAAGRPLPWSDDPLFATHGWVEDAPSNG